MKAIVNIATFVRFIILVFPVDRAESDHSFSICIPQSALCNPHSTIGILHSSTYAAIAFVTFSAASFRLSATKKLRPEDFRMSAANSAFVPARRITIGIEM